MLFGAVGDPRYDKLERAKRPEQAILGLRKELGLFANLRPARVHPELAGASALKPEVVAGLDILIVRELTGDIYFGQPQGHPAEGRRARRLRHHALQRERDPAHRARRLRGRAQALASACARSTRRTCSRPLSSGEKSSPTKRRSYPGRRADAHVRRQLRDAAGPQPEAIRRHRHRQHVRRHPVRRGFDAHRLDRHAAFGVARQPRQGPLRADPRHRARHRRQGPGQPARHHPFGGDDAALFARPAAGGRADREQR